MLVVLTAFFPEARPFIDLFGLQEQPCGDGKRIFLGAGVLLGISGQGRMRAAGMTKNLLKLLHEEETSPEPTWWLNFGVAGSGSFETGAMVVAHEVRDACSSRQWQLQPLVETGYPGATVLTVPFPSDAYENGIVYEMEASGMVSELADHAGQAGIMVVKMISDGPKDPVHSLPVGAVRSLIDKHRSRIRGLATLLFWELCT